MRSHERAARQQQIEGYLYCVLAVVAVVQSSFEWLRIALSRRASFSRIPPLSPHAHAVGIALMLHDSLQLVM